MSRSASTIPGGHPERAGAPEQGELVPGQSLLMILSDENYYLAAYYGETGEIRHYRVDKIKDLELLEDQPREGQKAIAQLDIPQICQYAFRHVQWRTDRCGTENQPGQGGHIHRPVRQGHHAGPDGPDQVRLTVKVEVSDQFLGWIMALGNGVEITNPGWVREKMVKEAEPDFGSI